MPKFIKLTYNNEWKAYLNTAFITEIQSRKDGRTLVQLQNETQPYLVDQTVEAIMEMING